MQSKKVKFCAMATMVVGLGITGCFGESILSAGAKVAGGQISQLTANEIRILNESVIGVLASTNPGFTAEPITEPQAEALATFLQVNSLNTIEDFETLAETAESDPESVEGLDELAEAFVDAEGFDEENFDLDQILGALFGTTGGEGGIGGGSGGGGGGENVQTNAS